MITGVSYYFWIILKICVWSPSPIPKPLAQTLRLKALFALPYLLPLSHYSSILFYSILFYSFSEIFANNLEIQVYLISTIHLVSIHRSAPPMTCRFPLSTPILQYPRPKVVTNRALIQAHRVFCLCFVWCPCMAINNVSVQYNGGFLFDMILLTQCYYHRETRLNAMKRFFVSSAAYL